MNKWVFRSFSRQCRWCQAPLQHYKSRRYCNECFERKFDMVRWITKMSQKQPKLKVIIHAFGLSWGPSSEHHGKPPRDMWGHWKEVMWLGTNMWMSLRSFGGNFGFHKKWANGCSEAFRDNANCVKHPPNVTSHITPRNVSGENISKPKQDKKCPKNSQNWRLYFTLLDFLKARAPNGTGWLLGAWEVIGKDLCGLERICACLYVHLEPILSFTR